MSIVVVRGSAPEDSAMVTMTLEPSGLTDNALSR